MATLVASRGRVSDADCVEHINSSWTPKRKAAASVLAVAVAALVIDRAVLSGGGPAPASADVVDGATDEGLPPPGDALAARGGPGASDAAKAATMITLAQRLEAARGRSTVQPGAVFLPPFGLVPPARVEEPTAAPAKAEPVAAAPARSWPRVSAVVAGARPGAILDGRLQRVGETHDGVELVSISDRGVTLRSGSEVITLTLEGPTR